MKVSCKMFGCDATHEHLVAFRDGTEDTRFRCFHCGDEYLWPQNRDYFVAFALIALVMIALSVFFF